MKFESWFVLLLIDSAGLSSVLANLLSIWVLSMWFVCCNGKMSYVLGLVRVQKESYGMILLYYVCSSDAAHMSVVKFVIV